MKTVRVPVRKPTKNGKEGAPGGRMGELRVLSAAVMSEIRRMHDETLVSFASDKHLQFTDPSVSLAAGHELARRRAASIRVVHVTGTQMGRSVMPGRAILSALRKIGYRYEDAVVTYEPQARGVVKVTVRISAGADFNGPITMYATDRDEREWEGTGSGQSDDDAVADALSVIKKKIVR